MMPPTRKRIVEYVVAILIGVGVVGAVILYAEVGPFAWMPSLRWWGLAANTALLVWVTLKSFRRYWHQRSFWLTMTAFICIHLLAWSAVLLSASEWGLLWFLPPLIIEAGLLVLAMHKLGFAISAPL